MAVVTPEVSIKLDHDEVLRVNEYRILSTIGRGAFSEVVLAQKDEHFFVSGILYRWKFRITLSIRLVIFCLSSVTGCHPDLPGDQVAGSCQAITSRSICWISWGR